LEEHAASNFTGFFIVPVNISSIAVVTTCLYNLTVLTALTSAVKVEAACIFQNIGIYLQDYRASPSELFFFQYKALHIP
jgi:hypothetical protein